ncbi:hypothetical protein SCUCBS95973_009861 [Sporothrix curviconia]|uniref:Major facilitator superfamily (MFS) profile domain-containing protein n=1 Tax=Sporothrix curviconia TaxID=1260050 RepID=A0ABP0CYK7_9PEZI
MSTTPEITDEHPHRVTQLAQLHQRGWTWRQFAYCSFVCLGEVAFAYPSSIIGVTLTQPSFLEYMGLVDSTGTLTTKGNSLEGALSGMFQAGGIFGILATIYAMDRWGRKMAVIIISAVGIVSATLLCASQNIAMFLVFRFFAGFASWGAVTVTPVYSAEMSPAALRGFFGAMNGIFIGIGYAFATYMGLAFYDTKSQSLGIWRGIYGIGLIFCFIPLLSMLIIPESPRWLLMAGRVDEAKLAMQKLHTGSSRPMADVTRAEFLQMTKQAEHDKELNTSWTQIIRLPANRRRAALAAGFAFLGQSTAILVINNYNSILYKGLGYGTRQTLVFQCGWITTGLSGNIVGSLIIDYIGRRPLILGGIIGALACLCVETALVATYASPVPEVGANRSGIGAAVAFLYLFTFSYGVGVDTTLWIFCSEIFPNHLRAKGIAICTLSFCLTGLVYLEVAATAFANIGYKYYLVFISVCAVGIVWLWIVLPETTGMPLEEIAAVFGQEEEVVIFSSDLQKDIDTGEVFAIEHAGHHEDGIHGAGRHGAGRHKAGHHDAAPQEAAPQEATAPAS